MTEREQKLIDAYIPSPRDTTLGDFEYYVEDLSGRVQRVEITDILPLLNDSDETIYLVVQSTTRKRVKGWGEYGGFTKGYMYDNKQDCKDGTHNCYAYWEKLRDMQMAEANT